MDEEEFTNSRQGTVRVQVYIRDHQHQLLSIVSTTVFKLMYQQETQFPAANSNCPCENNKIERKRDALCNDADCRYRQAKQSHITHNLHGNKRSKRTYSRRDFRWLNNFHFAAMTVKANLLGRELTRILRKHKRERVKQPISICLE